ncbi:flagellar basal body P-ring protein FlgI [Thalassoroseus pseudoceratinae]|uniref:flagellar basal body P-ring protein FlgI n=1 Tax=Thalassoroseus pseudoceratinae TaxID=2713176 RepID=UPI00141FCEF3|nr:flagellar basal body P-ring protein FlgI [Thalassoroseus pseudoceratinae]
MQRFTLILGLLVLVTMTNRASARVRLENICTIYGQKEVKLTGMGLVVGLQGTGDGGSNLPAMRALQAALQRMNAPTVVTELQNAKNVAMVMVEATVPATGLRKGQRLDAYVSSVMGAKSLRGGRLLITPLTSTDPRAQDVALALVSGPLFIQEAGQETTAKIPGGVVLEHNFPSLFHDAANGHRVTLLLDAAHSSFHSSNEIARAINTEFGFEVRYSRLAKASGPGVVQVQIPEQYHDDPVQFIALLLAISIENPHTQARVVVNAKTGVIIVTGEVEISPVVISHKNLTVQVGGANPLPVGPIPGRFVPLVDDTTEAAPQRLDDLIQALNQLRVPTEDVIAIIRELHRTGKLHAVFQEHG